jgi:Chaperone of endosialidase
MASHRIFSMSAALIAVVAFAQPAQAFDPKSATTIADASMGCENPAACTVAGAEVDDEATVKARAKIGTGPAAGIASDRRVKTDIKDLGRLENGLKVYSFRFLWEDTVRVGVIAQDLLEKPETKKAVLTLANGLLGVDYAALNMRMATQQQWLQHGASAMKADYTPQVRRSAQLDEPVQLFNKRPK